MLASDGPFATVWETRAVVDAVDVNPGGRNRRIVQPPCDRSMPEPQGCPYYLRDVGMTPVLLLYRRAQIAVWEWQHIRHVVQAWTQFFICTWRGGRQYSAWLELLNRSWIVAAQWGNLMDGHNQRIAWARGAEIIRENPGNPVDGTTLIGNWPRHMLGTQAQASPHFACKRCGYLGHKGRYHKEPNCPLHELLERHHGSGPGLHLLRKATMPLMMDDVRRHQPVDHWHKPSEYGDQPANQWINNGRRGPEENRNERGYVDETSLPDQVRLEIEEKELSRLSVELEDLGVTTSILSTRFAHQWMIDEEREVTTVLRFFVKGKDGDDLRLIQRRRQILTGPPDPDQPGAVVDDVQLAANMRVDRVMCEILSNGVVDVHMAKRTKYCYNHRVLNIQRPIVLLIRFSSVLHGNHIGEHYSESTGQAKLNKSRYAKDLMHQTNRRSNAGDIQVLRFIDIMECPTTYLEKQLGYVFGRAVDISVEDGRHNRFLGTVAIEDANIQLERQSNRQHYLERQEKISGKDARPGLYGGQGCMALYVTSTGYSCSVLSTMEVDRNRHLTDEKSMEFLDLRRIYGMPSEGICRNTGKDSIKRMLSEEMLEQRTNQCMQEVRRQRENMRLIPHDEVVAYDDGNGHQPDLTLHPRGLSHQRPAREPMPDARMLPTANERREPAIHEYLNGELIRAWNDGLHAASPVYAGQLRDLFHDECDHYGVIHLEHIRNQHTVAWFLSFQLYVITKDGNRLYLCSLFGCLRHPEGNGNNSGRFYDWHYAISGPLPRWMARPGRGRDVANRYHPFQALVAPGQTKMLQTGTQDAHKG